MMTTRNIPLTCECALCAHARDFDAYIQRVTDPDANKFFTDLYERYESTDFDRDYYQCIIDGSWPGADEIINTIRERRLAQIAAPGDSRRS